MILPTYKYKQAFDVIIMIMLIYTASWVPYKICFEDEVSRAQFIFDLFVDFFFFMDIILTFFTAYQDSYGNLEVRKKMIAVHYLKGFFFIDLVTTLPF